MTIKAVLFDWDGTLYDIFDFIVKTYGQVMREKGLREWSRREFREKFKIDWRDTLKDMGLEEHEEYLVGVWKRNLEEMKEELQLHENAKETIIELSRKYTVGIVSSAPRNALLKEVNRLGVKEYIKVIVSKNDTKETKPSPMPLLQAAKKLKVKPEECVYVGDMIEDIQATRRAEMKSIAVPWGLHSRGRLMEEKPDYMAGKFKEIIEFIDKIQ
ncbi:MAG: HAD family hydrolase [Candidatus Altiarchaeota archaeon]|nr:HAD family hydrolase [Candidatus Altiarchaeota archaeon]